MRRLAREMVRVMIKNVMDLWIREQTIRTLVPG
jgi:hypothetical protein